MFVIYYVVQSKNSQYIYKQLQHKNKNKYKKECIVKYKKESKNKHKKECIVKHKKESKV